MKGSFFTLILLPLLANCETVFNSQINPKKILINVDNLNLIDQFKDLFRPYTQLSLGFQPLEYVVVSVAAPGDAAVAALEPLPQATIIEYTTSTSTQVITTIETEYITVTEEVTVDTDRLIDVVSDNIINFRTIHKSTLPTITANIVEVGNTVEDILITGYVDNFEESDHEYTEDDHKSPELSTQENQVLERQISGDQTLGNLLGDADQSTNVLHSLITSTPQRTVYIEQVDEYNILQVDDLDYSEQAVPNVDILSDQSFTTFTDPELLKTTHFVTRLTPITKHSQLSFFNSSAPSLRLRFDYSKFINNTGIRGSDEEALVLNESEDTKSMAPVITISLISLITLVSWFLLIV